MTACMTACVKDDFLQWYIRKIIFRTGCFFIACGTVRRGVLFAPALFCRRRLVLFLSVVMEMQKLRLCLADIGFQRQLVYQRGNDAQMRDTESGRVGGDADRLIQRVALGQIRNERRNEGVGAAGRIYRHKGRGRKIFIHIGGLEVAALFAQRDDHGLDAFFQKVIGLFLDRSAVGTKGGRLLAVGNKQIDQGEQGFRQAFCADGLITMRAPA